MFSERLTASIRQTNSIICLGLDPFVDLMPDSWKKRQIDKDPLSWIQNYMQEALEIAQGKVPVIKPQSAFFEAYGAAGVKVFESLIHQAKEMGFLVIADVKRGDIGTTAAAYAEAFLPLADAVTVNPYMGEDTVRPFIERATKHDAGLFILVKTSNPSAKDFQDIIGEKGQPLYESIAQKVHHWGQELISGDLSSVGAVVGATWPEQGKKIRSLMPQTPFLIPGYGAQGGTVEGVKACRRSDDDQGLLVNSSRGLLYAWRQAKTADWKQALNTAIDQMNHELKSVWE